MNTPTTTQPGSTEPRREPRRTRGPQSHRHHYPCHAPEHEEHDTAGEERAERRERRRRSEATSRDRRMERREHFGPCDSGRQDVDRQEFDRLGFAERDFGPRAFGRRGFGPRTFSSRDTDARTADSTPRPRGHHHHHHHHDEHHHDDHRAARREAREAFTGVDRALRKLTNAYLSAVSTPDPTRRDQARAILRTARRDLRTILTPEA